METAVGDAHSRGESHSGASGGFECFFRAQYPVVVRIAWGVLGDAHLAEDVAQDVMIAARRRFPGLDEQFADEVGIRASRREGTTRTSGTVRRPGPGGRRGPHASRDRRDRRDRRDPDSTEHAAAWVRTAAAHLALNAIRGRRRHDARQQRVRPGGAAAGPEDVLLDRETDAEVRRALGRLPVRSATVLVLRHSGLSYAEVAAAMGAPVGAVGTMLRRAEAGFRKEIEKEIEVKVEDERKVDDATRS